MSNKKEKEILRTVECQEGTERKKVCKRSMVHKKVIGNVEKCQVRADMEPGLCRYRKRPRIVQVTGGLQPT